MTGGIDVETRRVEDRPDDDPVLGSPRVQRKLAELRGRSLNFDPSGAEDYDATTGWRVDDFRQDLPAEGAGPPLEGGSFAVAQRLMRGYEFADPSIVHAYYDPHEPLLGRTMLLAVRFHGLRFHAGVRVVDVYERSIEDGGRPVHLWGWGYGTLAGHFEMGRMDWQLWKWTDTGEVQFRIHAFSRRAPDRNPIVRAGFRLFGRREQLAFLRSTRERMEALTTLGVRSDTTPGDVQDAADELTARSGDTRVAHRALAHHFEGGVTEAD